MFMILNKINLELLNQNFYNYQKKINNNINSTKSLKKLNLVQKFNKLLRFQSIIQKNQWLKLWLKIFFQGLQKDKISLPKIQKFYQLLRNKKLSSQNIDTLKLFVQSGRRMKIQQFLQKLFGIYQGQKIFQQFQSQFIAKQTKPLGNSQFVKNLHGLKIYKYPQNHISDYDKNNSKSIIILGQTGCGKSTFLNTLTNYLAGVQIEDSWRYYIVVENIKNHVVSATKEIISYYVKDVRTGNCYRIIDTPGFGDTAGIQKDYQTVQNINNFLKFKLQQIHLVLFLTRSTNTRITDFQKYIFQNVMDLFDKTIAENFVFILTFADNSQPVILKHLQNKQGFGTYWKAIKQPKSIKINNSGFFQKIQKEDQIQADFWKKGCKKMSELIKKAQQITSKSLYLTKQLIKKKENLSLRIKNTSQCIQNHIISQENIRQQILKLLQNEQQMIKNQKFQIQIDQQQWYGIDVTQNVTRCNNCMNSIHRGLVEKVTIIIYLQVKNDFNN